MPNPGFSEFWSPEADRRCRDPRPGLGAQQFEFRDLAKLSVQSYGVRLAKATGLVDTILLETGLCHLRPLPVFAPRYQILL